MAYRTYITSGNIISSLGWTVGENFNHVVAGTGGIDTCRDRGLSDSDLPASLVDTAELESRFGHLAPGETFTRFEKLGILSAMDALTGSGVDPDDPRTIMILSTTKGNVELLEKEKGIEEDRLLLWRAAQVMSDFLGMNQRPIVVSNACISGVVAMLQAQRLISSGKYDHAIVTGADVLSRFIVSGFQSFLSLSSQACRPFDETRDGLTLGEAAATVVISREPAEIELVGGAVTNDANHISGPSRTGEGLFLAIGKSLADGSVPDLVSAHGTATVYNDEMEAIALSRSGLEKVPVNSLKGYFGHTLGAAGIVESIISMESMRHGVVAGTLGYGTPGVSRPIQVVEKAESMQVNCMLKTASGFGGCNAAALFRNG